MAIVKIPSHSRVTAFSNSGILFLFSWKRGFLIGSGNTGPVGSHQCCIMSRLSPVRKCTHWIRLMVNIMASNIVHGLIL